MSSSSQERDVYVALCPNFNSESAELSSLSERIDSGGTNKPVIIHFPFYEYSQTITDLIDTDSNDRVVIPLMTSDATQYNVEIINEYLLFKSQRDSSRKEGGIDDVKDWEIKFIKDATIGYSVSSSARYVSNDNNYSRVIPLYRQSYTNSQLVSLFKFVNYLAIQPMLMAIAAFYRKHTQESSDGSILPYNEWNLLNIAEGSVFYGSVVDDDGNIIVDPVTFKLDDESIREIYDKQMNIVGLKYGSNVYSGTKTPNVGDPMPNQLIGHIREYTSDCHAEYRNDTWILVDNEVDRIVGRVIQAPEDHIQRYISKYQIIPVLPEMFQYIS